MDRLRFGGQNFYLNVTIDGLSLEKWVLSCQPLLGFLRGHLSPESDDGRRCRVYFDVSVVSVSSRHPKHWQRYQDTIL